LKYELITCYLWGSFLFSKKGYRVSIARIWKYPIKKYIIYIIYIRDRIYKCQAILKVYVFVVIDKNQKGGMQEAVNKNLEDTVDLVERINLVKLS
jgi:hypothetical protein